MSDNKPIFSPQKQFSSSLSLSQLETLLKNGIIHSGDNEELSILLDSGKCRLEVDFKIEGKMLSHAHDDTSHFMVKGARVKVVEVTS